VAKTELTNQDEPPVLADSEGAGTSPDVADESAAPLADASLSDAFAQGEPIEHLGVRLSNEVVVLLPEQLYTSPLKAIEELVANSYDADGTECRIGLLMQDRNDGTHDGLIAVYDDGSGMDKAGLAGLWQIGDRRKAPPAWQVLRVGPARWRERGRGAQRSRRAHETPHASL
jgi:hypothetical protein